MPRYPVAIVRQSDPSYPAHAPFHPPARYPEFAEGRGEYELDASNHVYASVRDALLLLGLDAPNAGTARWNPLAGIVRPGDTVFLKPNLITHRHQLRPDEWDSGDCPTRAWSPPSAERSAARSAATRVAITRRPPTRLRR